MELDTHHRIAKSISSQQMGNSEIQKRIINLGKALVAELGLDPGVDTIARWMAHYVAEQMIIAENATDDDKTEAERICFETILKLWYHRSSFPSGRRPFESFEPIFRALERLDPENPAPYFRLNPNFHSSVPDDSDDEPDEVQEWLNIAQGVDQVARVLLEHIFHQAALMATDEKTIALVKNSVGLTQDDDVALIVHLTSVEPMIENKEVVEQELQAKQKSLETRIKQLDAFAEFSQAIRAAFEAELDTITPIAPSANVVDTDSQK